MTQDEIKKAQVLLDSRTERYETAVLDGEDDWYALTVHWRDGGQKIFYRLSQVQDWLAEKRQWERAI